MLHTTGARKPAVAFPVLSAVPIPLCCCIVLLAGVYRYNGNRETLVQGKDLFFR